jgi:hypothetical protein
MKSHISSEPNRMANADINTLKLRASPKTVTVVELKLCDNCTAEKNKDDPSKYRAYSVEDLMEEYSNHIATFDHNSHNATNRHRHLAKFPSFQLTTEQINGLHQATEAVLNYADQKSADIALAGTIIGTLCQIPFWSTAAATMGQSVIVGTLVCGWASEMAALIFNHFMWFGDPTLDNAFWNVRTSNWVHAAGDSLNIAYHRGGDRDNDYLGYIGINVLKETEEDLDSRAVEYIEGKLLLYNPFNFNLCSSHDCQA